MPASAMRDEQVEIREADTAAKRAESTKKQLHQIGDIMRQVNSFAFLGCACGLKMKIPPNLTINLYYATIFL